MLYILKEGAGEYDDYVEFIVAVVSGEEDPTKYLAEWGNSVSLIREEQRNLHWRKRKKFTFVDFADWLIKEKGYKKVEFKEIDSYWE